MDEGINWARGILRLWLIGAIGWSGFYAYKTQLVEPAYQTALSRYVVYKMGPLQPWEVEPDKSLDKSKIKLVKVKEGEAQVKHADLPDGTFVEFPVDMPDKEIRPIINKGMDAMAAKARKKLRAINDYEQRKAEIMPQVREFLVMGMGPPLGLLFLGILLNWILKGFRPKAWD